MLFFSFLVLRYQGLNTGVVLYNLERMRASKEWASYLRKEEVGVKCCSAARCSAAQVRDMMPRTGFMLTVGDQDWFTKISFHVSFASFP